MDRAIDWFTDIDPKKRRKAAFVLLVVSFVLGHLNIGMFVFGVIPPNVMDAITNYLSWLALVLTALDVIISSDVRVNQTEGESDAEVAD